LSGLKAMLLLCAAIGGACLPQAPARALTVTPQECHEGADFIGNAVRSRDNGMPARQFIARLDEDLVLIQAYSPEIRWFAHDEDDARFLRGWVLRVFQDPSLPELHGRTFLADCLATATSTGE
jgi:hypothetical protein